LNKKRNTPINIQCSSPRTKTAHCCLTLLELETTSYCHTPFLNKSCVSNSCQEPVLILWIFCFREIFHSTMTAFWWNWRLEILHLLMGLECPSFDYLFSYHSQQIHIYPWKCVLIEPQLENLGPFSQSLLAATAVGCFSDHVTVVLLHVFLLDSEAFKPWGQRPKHGNLCNSWQ
jgi:hypothetical protein